MSEPIPEIEVRIHEHCARTAMKLANDQRPVTLDTLCCLFDGVDVPTPPDGMWLITKLEYRPAERQHYATARMVAPPLAQQAGFTGGAVHALPGAIGLPPGARVPEVVMPKDRLL